MTTSILVFAALGSASVAFSISPIVLRFLRARDIVDSANLRSSHQGAVPRGGGIAVLAAIIVTAAVVASVNHHESPIVVSVVFVTLFGALGLWDDLRGLDSRLRLAFQTLLAVGFTALSGLSGPTGIGFLDFVLACSWIVFFVNAFNFMDGINGISVATAVVIGSALAAGAVLEASPEAGLLAAVTVGASVGFAPFNTPTARMFLGDVGSYSIGAALAISGLANVDANVPLIAILLPFAIYICDVLLTLVRRAVRGEGLMEAHRDHIYQLLANGPWSHVRTTMVVTAATSSLAVVGLLAPARSPGQLLALSAGCLIVATYALLPVVILTRPSASVRRAGGDHA